MRINRDTVLVGRMTVLVPYRKQHVPRYHEWMKDPLIQEQTASEPLSLEEEYEMQQSWAVDEDKLTFIILARPDEDVRGTRSAVGVDEFLSECKMVGDVNIFFNQRHEEDEDEDNAEEQSSVKDAVFDAECEIMIAEHSYRRKGIAREALEMMFAFVTSDPTPVAAPLDNFSTASVPASTDTAHCSLPIPSDWLTCKISLSNAPSIKLFESLGFTRQKVSEVWQEVEMRFTDRDPARFDQYRKSIERVLFWPDD
ncbi:GNAT domain protein [Kalmanozyma brasiliensis GHG001]|uniref:GNAT domain protein n=1 Tax=Kalmanozyma brasiliensis (strain GHG001) TaxID=1365824 RepID=UPI002867B0A7|nr:GNAT domain protein [Kalmanozyma brasiliensis GHG001]EST09764.2 GNAT domain protein [Kalmanozyma brasiliensis GHG001]